MNNGDNTKCCLDIIHDGIECTCEEHKRPEPTNDISFGGSTGSGAQLAINQTKDGGDNICNTETGHTEVDTASEGNEKLIKDIMRMYEEAGNPPIIRDGDLEEDGLKTKQVAGEPATKRRACVR